MKKEKIVEWCCALLVLLFVYAGLSKFFPMSLFIHDMQNQPFPRWLVSVLIWALPLGELLVSLALIVKRTRTAGLWASLILMLAFTGYTGAILVGWFHRMPCSCGGVIRDLTWGQHLILNLVFTGIAGTGLRLHTMKTINQAKNNYVAA